MNKNQCAGGGFEEAMCPLAGEKGCRAMDELNLLLNISYTLESSLDLREVIRPILLKMEELMGLQCGMIIILDRESGKFSASEAVGLPRHLSKEEYLQHYRSLIDGVIHTGQAVVVPDISAEPSLKLEVADGALEKTAFICVPVKFGEEVVGCLSAERLMQAEVSLAADRRLLSLVANAIAQSAHFNRITEERLNTLRTENERLQEQLRTSLRPPNMIGNSNAMRSVYLHIEQVAGSATTVLIRGESGVGKELVARALHEQSPRKGRAFVKFNCAALPESIIESELFGHEKGAFTGAIAMRKGRFETAEGGTIFLDEIGDISLTTQIKLLRVLQEKEFERVGSQTPIRSNVRIITATSRNLEEMIETGKFRSDLYYRLNVFPIYVPPLRERKADILLLADYFVEKYAKQNQKTVRRISTAAIDLLASYHWPGNVRELENCIERAVLLCPDKVIEAHHLPPTLQKKDPSEKSSGGTLESAVAALEYEMVVAELKASDGNMAAAARNLGLTERQIGLRVKRFNIDFKRFRRGDESAAPKVTSA
jgi:Nif-specific regulatory protein